MENFMYFGLINVKNIIRFSINKLKFLCFKNYDLSGKSLIMPSTSKDFINVIFSSEFTVQV